MAKYHINPETGRPNQCTAKVRCRFGADTEHFDSKDAARTGYEKQMEGQTVSGSLKKTSVKPAAVTPVFDAKSVEDANEKIQNISNGAVMIGLADYGLSDSSTLIVAFDAEHDMCIVIEDQDGKKFAYTAYGPDPRRTRTPVSEFVTASRIDDLAMETAHYRPGGWQMEPSKQGEQIAKVINDLVSKDFSPAKQEVPKKATSKTAPAVSKAPAQLPVIPGVPPISTDQELNQEVAELQEDLHGFTINTLLRTRDVDLREIEEEERKGNYVVTAKVPSYYELSISTDLARRELGLPPRKKTGVDESPLRLAQIKKDEAYSKTFGMFHSAEDSKAARDRYNAARYEYDVLRNKHYEGKK